MQKINSNKIVIDRKAVDGVTNVVIHENSADIVYKPKEQYLIDGDVTICSDGLLYVDGEVAKCIEVPNYPFWSGKYNSVRQVNGVDVIKAHTINGKVSTELVDIPLQHIFLNDGDVYKGLWHKTKYIQPGYYKLRTISLFNRIYANYVIDNRKLIPLREL